MIKLIGILLINFLLGYNFTTFNSSDYSSPSAFTSVKDTAKLIRLQDAVKRTQNTKKSVLYADSLYHEAVAQHNYKFAALASYYHIIYYYNHFEVDSVNRWMPTLTEYSKKADFWDTYFDAKRFQIDLLTYEYNFQLAEKEGKILKEKAYKLNNPTGKLVAHQSLAMLYSFIDQKEKSLWHLKKAKSFITKKTSIILQISIYTQLIMMNYQLEDFESYLVYTKKLEESINKFKKAHPAVIEIVKNVDLFVYLSYTLYHINDNNLEAAEEYLKKAQTLITPNTFRDYTILFYESYSKYYKAKQKYDKALTYIDSALVYENGNHEKINKLNIKKARILHLKGEEKLATQLYKQSIINKDSITKSTYDKQLEQIIKNYNLKKIELEKIKIQNRLGFLFLFTVLLTFIILLFFMAKSIKIRYQLKESEEEIKKTTKQIMQVNDMKNHFLYNMSYNIRTPLNTIVGFSQLIATEQDLDDKELKEYSLIIQESSKKLIALISDILNLSRLESNMMKFKVEQFDLITICKEAIYMANNINENKIKIDLITKVEKQMIVTDIKQLTNAILSTLTLQKKEKAEKEISIKISINEDATFALIYIKNSPLINSENQETSIKHNINRLLMEHFSGCYEIIQVDKKTKNILFTYPIYNKG